MMMLILGGQSVLERFFGCLKCQPLLAYHRVERIFFGFLKCCLLLHKRTGRGSLVKGRGPAATER
jgi:hypothetical protein